MKNVSAIRFLLAVTSLVISSAAYAQGITIPRTPSPAAEITQTIGISTVTINYSRPSVKGRAIWGDLVPYGWNVQAFGNQNSAPWRAGANENTTIEFSHAAKVEGQMVPAGLYGLFFTVNADNTGEVILSKDNRSWGSFFYEPDHDQLRAKIQTRTHPMTEMLTFDFINLTKTSGELVLNWENKQFPVKIEFAVDEIVMANADEELKGVAGFSFQGYASAANYALQNKTNTEQAVEWADKAVTMNPNFNTLNTKAGLLEMQGKKADADKVKAEALAVATETELNTYGYTLLNQGDNKEAIRIFQTNVDRHPESANAWDSLGEGYALSDDKENAIKCFKKSLTLNPNDGVKANSMMYLKKLGAL